MATKYRRKKNNFIVPIIVVVILIFVLILIVVLTNKQKAPMTQEQIVDLDKKYQEERNKEIKKDLSSKSELERMQFYCGEFFKLIDGKNYEKAYDLLYSDYKENYFPTLENFKRYFKEYFPSDFGLSYQNIERLGDIYVLMVSVKDIVNGSYGNNFDMYVVLQEKALNDYVISFSRNSAVGEEE